MSPRLLAATSVLLLAVASAPVMPANAGVVVTTMRIEGADRYATAARIAASTFPEGAPGAVLVRGDDFPDALSAAGLAAFEESSPVLLTDPDVLPQPTKVALQELGVERVTLLGGADAISSAVERELEALGVRVSRIAGGDRYATAVAAAQSCRDECGTGLIDGKRTAILVSGTRFGDAIAAGPISYGRRLPILLTTRDALPEATRQALQPETDPYEHVVIIGGTAVVSDRVEQALRAMNITVERIAGADRTETAVRVAEFAQQRLRWTITHVNLARGDAFADALAGSVHGGIEEGPILLTSNPSTITQVTLDYLSDNNVTIDSIDIFGSQTAVSQEVAERARDAATLP